jgi:hypothetical protein
MGVGAKTKNNTTHKKAVEESESCVILLMGEELLKLR